jgi:hypothetical protein
LLRRLLRWLTGDDLPLGCLAGASMQGTRQGYSDRSRWRSETFHEKTTGSHPHIRKVNLDARRPYIGTSVSIRQSTSCSTSTPDSSCFQLAVLANRCTAQHPPSLLPLNVMKYTEALHGITTPFRSWALHLYSILNMVFQYIILCRFDGSISRPNTKDLRVYYLGHERVSMCRSVVLMHLGRGFEVALRIQGVEVDPLPARMTGAV